MALTALGVAACGSGGSATATTAAPKLAARQVPTVRVAKTRLGKVLVDSRGHTLYLFKKDSGTKSACSGACATAWPPLRASRKTTVGGGAKASLVGTTKRSDGKSQVTYNRHPLYTFIKDTKAGQTNGEGLTAFGARWYAVSAAGKQVSRRKHVSSQPSKSASGSASSRAPAPTATPAPKAAPRPTPRPAPTSTPAPKKSPSNGIAQNNGGDQDSDNNGGPSDGDGGV
jgi:predicted lipoprotein with Yx(FWY)xxD motif